MASGFDLASFFGGAVQGGTVGAAAGPWGAAAGALVGGVTGGLTGGGSSGRGSQDVRDPAYHGEHWGREAAFRTSTCGTFAAPTGRARDVEIPQRTQALGKILGYPSGEPLRRILEIGRRVGLPDGCLNLSTFFGVGPVPAAVPFAGGWPQFALAPSVFQQLAQRSGLGEAALFSWIVTGQGFTSAPPPASPVSLPTSAAPTVPAPVPVPSGPMIPLASMAALLHQALAELCRPPAAGSPSYTPPSGQWV